MVVLRYPELIQVEESVAHQPLRLPYIPGLLSFREGPAILKAWEGLQERPDLILFDGQGIAHPRRLGIASHLGVLLDWPTIGVAKSLLVGRPDPNAEALGPHKGDWLPLVDRHETIGRAVRTRSHVKPVYVSPGHRCTVPEAAAWSLATCTRFRLPEPIRSADARASRHKQGL